MINKLNIPEYWIETHGLGTNVAIIDSGFDLNNIYIKNNISIHKSFGGNNNKHGTNIAGIICSNPNKQNVYNSFAYKTNLFLFDMPFKQSFSQNKLIQILQYISNYSIDVINMSFAYSKNNSTIQFILKQFAKKNVILISAYSQAYLFPHSYSFVISAGKDVVTKKQFVTTSLQNSFERVSGTSMQSAYLSSLAALAKSYNKKINNNFFLQKLLTGKTLKNIENRKQINIKIN